MGGATLPPWLTPWSPALYAGRAYKPGQRPHPRLTIFTYGHSNSAPLLRFGSWSAAAGSPPPAAEGPAPPPPGGMHWERVPLDRAPWHLEVPVPDRAQPKYDITSHSDSDMFSADGMELEGDSPTLAAVHAYGSVLRGWACGAALLALFILLVRLGERLLDWKIVLRRRRLHRERQRARANAGVEASLGAARPPPYSTLVLPGGAVPGKVVGGVVKAGEGAPPPYGTARAGKITPPRRIARLLQACGVRALRRDRPPPLRISSRFGSIMYYPMEWNIFNQGVAPVDPPPVYSTADPTSIPNDDVTRPDDAEAADPAPNYVAVEPNVPDVDPPGADADAAPKNGPLEV